MKWDDQGRSDDLEDRRGGGGGGGVGRLGLGGFLLVGLLSIVFRRNFFALIGDGGGAGTTAPVPVDDAKEEKLVHFVSFAIDDVQKTWDRELARQTSTPYHHAKLVLFRASTQSGCGHASAGMGPFYCPADEKAYIDLSFYEELKTKFGAPGELAQAYVLAHEIGHHVQKLIGVEATVRKEQQRHPAKENDLSIRMELQADCFAGIWGHSTQDRGHIEGGDLESALAAAAAVGDDRLQKKATGEVHPESWTHGSSQQRMKWFRRGFKAGNVEDCDTFASDQP